MILPPRVSRRIRAGAPLGWLAGKARARTPAMMAEPPGRSSVTSTANRRRTREEPGNMHSIASASRWPVPRAGHDQGRGPAGELAIKDQEREPAEMVPVQVRYEHGADPARVEAAPPQRGQ